MLEDHIQTLRSYIQHEPAQELCAGLPTSITTRASETALGVGFETPVKLKTSESGTMEELEPLIPFNFVQESPIVPGENCLTSALGRTLSQKNEIWNLGSNIASFGDFCTQASIFGYESYSGVPA